MKIISALSLFLSGSLSVFGQVWPASTNADQTLFGKNTFSQGIFVPLNAATPVLSPVGTLIDPTSSSSLVPGVGYINDSSGIASISWWDRNLRDPSGASTLNWSTRNLGGGWTNNQPMYSASPSTNTPGLNEFVVANYVNNYPVAKFSNSGNAAVGFLGYDSTPAITEIADAPSDGNYYGRQNGAWSLVPIPSTVTYYLQPTNVPSSTHLAMVVPPYPTRTVNSFAGLSTGSMQLTNYLTSVGYPGISFIPAGTVLMHIHAAQTAGSKTTLLYAQVWETDNTGADINQIGVTANTGFLTGSEVEYYSAFVLDDIYTMSSTASLIKLKVFVTVGSTGTAPTVQFYMGGEADSHFSIPAPPLDLSQYATSATLTTASNALQAQISAPILTNKIYYTNVFELTNAQSTTVDMTFDGDVQTSGAITFAGLKNKSLTNYQAVVLTVFNSAGTAAAVNPMANCHANGPQGNWVTNISKVLFEYHPLYNYTNMLVFPLF